jgi:replicative DNA helicase
MDLSALDYERALLGLAISFPLQLLPALADRLRPRHFEALLHRRLWQAILGLYERQAAIEAMTVATCLSGADLAAIGGVAGLSGLYDGASPEAAGEICRVLDDRAARRALYRLAGQMQSAALDPEADSRQFGSRVQVAVEHLELISGATASAASVGETLLAQMAAIQTAEEAGPPDLTSGFTAIDAYLATGGLGRGNLSAIGGRTGMGKSVFGAQCATRNAVNGRRVAIFSLEMSQWELTQRIISQVSGVDFTKIIKPHLLLPGEKNNIVWTATDLQPKLAEFLFIDDRAGLTYREIGSVCSRLKRGKGLDIAIIDHLQLVNGPERERRQMLGRASEYFKKISADLDCHVMELSQLPRPSDKRASDFRPQLWDFKESGDIENSLDLGAFIHREGYYDPLADQGQAEFIIRKQRNGPVGTALLGWEAACVRFR